MSRYWDKFELPSKKLPSLDWVEIEECFLYLNGEEIEDTSNMIQYWIKHTFTGIKICPYCNAYLKQAQFRWRNKEGEEGPVKKYCRVWVCLNCFYWQTYWKETWFDDPSPPINDEAHTDLFVLSKLRSFEPGFPEGLDSELAQALRQDNGRWHELTPKRLEKLIAAMFKANYSDCEVIHIGKPFDGGSDIFFVDDSNHQWFIQVKRREHKDSVEGVNTLRNLLGVMFLKDASYGIIASTADHFSYFACKEAEQAEKKGKIIRLLDKGKLNRMLGPLLPDRPWLDVLAELDSRAAESLDVKLLKIKSFQKFKFDFGYK